MNFEEKRQIKELLKGTDNVLIITDNGCAVVGNVATILANYSVLTKILTEKIDEKLVKESFELAFKTEIELLQKIEELLKKINGGKDGK